MDQLQISIKYLLNTQDCVVVPGFGAFVMRRVGARYNSEKQVFKAPNKEVSFNKLLVEDDGLLIAEVAKLRECDYASARTFVEEQVSQAWQQLEDGNTIHIKGVGKLKNHIRGILHFTPVADVNFRNDMYGMFDLYVAPVHKTKKLRTNGSQAGVIRRVAVAAALLLALFFYSQPLRNSLLIEEAGFVLIENTKAEPILPQATPTIDVSIKSDFAQLNEVAQTTILQEEIDEIEEVDALRGEEIELTVAEVLKPEIQYHIIIGSVASIEMATKAMASFKQRDIESTMLDCGNRYRISHKAFTDKAEAIKFWQTFRESSKQFSDSWIYVEKANS